MVGGLMQDVTKLIITFSTLWPKKIMPIELKTNGIDSSYLGREMF